MVLGYNFSVYVGRTLLMNTTIRQHEISGFLTLWNKAGCKIQFVERAL